MSTAVAETRKDKGLPAHVVGVHRTLPEKTAEQTLGRKRKKSYD